MMISVVNSVRSQYQLLVAYCLLRSASLWRLSSLAFSQASILFRLKFIDKKVSGRLLPVLAVNSVACSRSMLRLVA